MFTFRNAQYEYNLFDLYAAPEIAQHLEALAQQGWQLEHIGPVFWRYRKCPPADLHYAVVYFPKDHADEYISRQQRELWELCRTTGWELAATAGQMQVFRTAEKEPVPIETDPVVQMETIHAAMRVRDSVLFAGSLIFYILLLLPLLLLTRSAGNWAAWFRLFLPALLLYILPCCILPFTLVPLGPADRSKRKPPSGPQGKPASERCSYHSRPYLPVPLPFQRHRRAELLFGHTDRCCHPRDDLSIGSLFQAPSPAATTWKTDCCRVSCGSLRFRAGSLPWLHCGPPYHFRASKC